MAALWIKKRDGEPNMELLDRAAEHAREGDGKKAFNALADAKWKLIGTDAYTEPLVDAFDDALKAAWDLMHGVKGAAEKVLSAIKRVKKLVEKPKGERARPPAQPKTKAEHRLWLTAQRVVEDQYPDIPEERYWKLVSAVFRRMAGGKKEVRKIAEEIVFSALKVALRKGRLT